MSTVNVKTQVSLNDIIFETQSVYWCCEKSFRGHL